MIEKVHQHIINELQQSSKTDTVFIITAVLFNLLLLAINSAIASNAVSENARSSDDFVLVVYLLMLLIVNIIVVNGLSTGKSTRQKLLDGLMSMYQDNNVDKYYDSTLLKNYGKRYSLLICVILCLAATSFLVPMIVRFI